VKIPSPRALDFFKAKQNADGSWGAKDKGAMTGFVILCYLGRCETPDSRTYGDTVMKGILYLVELGKKNPDGIFLGKSKTPTRPTYEHGIATYALGEMYTLAPPRSEAAPRHVGGFSAGR